MMPGMSNEAQEEAAAAGAWRWWILPALVLAMSAYMLWMGETLVLHQQHGLYWFFFAPWWASTSLKFLAVSAGLAAVLFFGRERARRWLPAGLAVLLLGGQIWCARAAWSVVGGAVPWGFDHPSFLFRLKEFGGLFPGALGGYNPWWNAGVEHFVGVTSGAQGFGVLIWPLLQFRDPHEFYGAALIFWFVFGFPWLGVLAARSAGIERAGALCAGLLMCGASREVFMWMWHYGTVGAMTSAMMTLPVVALGYRLAVLRRGGAGTALALGVSAWLMCLWTPGVFVGAGLGLGWLWNARRWSWRSNRWVFAAGALALLLLAPWFWTTLFPCRNVMEYVGTDLPLPGWGAIAAKGADRLQKLLEEWHPALLFLGLFGSVFAVPREMRRWMLPVFLVLGAIAGWSRELKPLSQLERMAVPMAVAAVFPAAALCGRLFAEDAPRPASGERRRAAVRALAQGLVLTVLLMGLIRVGKFYANRDHTGIKMRVLPAGIAELADWIRAEVPAEGRLAFAGMAGHFYGGGNIAYLPVLAGREMMADDYYGFPRGTIEYKYPPGPYRQNVETCLFFSRAYGITHWAAVQPEAIALLASHPDRFERVKSMAMPKYTIEIYRIKDFGPVSRFWEGAGRVAARANRIDVFPADPAAARVVIRYNWRAGLVCRTPGATIEPFAVDENLNFIAIHPGGNERVAIGYRPHAAPVKPNFDGTFHH